ncbi:alpha/beta fold hydrolase [Leekyejoonella antrihumi]|uniref:Alpha/beta hydrolase n=1 Tax=Leekyejoonella antrihumi TaxID=1660198 RepID=A0A563DWT4_9MICO|nr:hypothetical protein [Leekyejoonella antrihumi]TWP34686.1 hypothetical protein FGL98_16360 [Leekyejoonella antrihumi]
MKLDDTAPAVLALHTAAPTADWPAPSIDEVTLRKVTFAEDTDLASRVTVAARAIDEFGSPMHVLASGDDGAVAIRLAVTHPELVKSLVLADATSHTALGDVTADLTAVTVPALVVCAAPELNSDLTASQELAGQISNGVFVVMDRVERPAHRARPDSFNAWSDSFISIVEGLRGLA